VVLIHGKKTVQERWEMVVREFSMKSGYVRCPEKPNPREFLEGLRIKLRLGLRSRKGDYFSVIISSLPFELSNFASNQLAAAQFTSNSSNPMTPDPTASTPSTPLLQNDGKGEGRDEALAVGQSQQPKGKARRTHLLELRGEGPC
jgi:hypothetical protein